MTCAQFVKDLRERKVTPHIAIDGHLSKTGKPRVTAIDGRTQTPSGLCAQPTLPQAHRGGVRLDQGLRRHGQGQAARLRPCGRGLHLEPCRLQSDPPAQAAGGPRVGSDMSLAGRWRIVAMPDYVEDYPDMMEPAYILFDGNGSGEFAFGCVTGHLIRRRRRRSCRLLLARQ